MKSAANEPQDRSESALLFNYEYNASSETLYKLH